MDKLREALEEMIRNEVAQQMEAALSDLRTKAPIVAPVAPVDPRRLYSVASAAKLLEVSTGYVYDRINKGEIAVVELGDGKPKQRISAPELQSFIDARTFGGSDT